MALDLCGPPISVGPPVPFGPELNAQPAGHGPGFGNFLTGTMMKNVISKKIDFGVQNMYHVTTLLRESLLKARVFLRAYEMG